MIYISNFDPTEENVEEILDAISKLPKKEQNLIQIYKYAMPPELDDFDYDYASARALGMWCVVSIHEDKDLIRRFFNLWLGYGD